MKLEITSEEISELISLLNFHQENLDEDDERWEPTTSLLDKLHNL